MNIDYLEQKINFYSQKQSQWRQKKTKLESNFKKNNDEITRLSNKNIKNEDFIKNKIKKQIEINLEIEFAIKGIQMIDNVISKLIDKKRNLINSIDLQNQSSTSGYQQNRPKL